MRPASLCLTRCCLRSEAEIEGFAAWSYRHPAKVSPAIQKRHDSLPKAVIDRAWDAQLRLCKRYRKLTARGKHRNVAVVAIARELAGFIRDIARMTPITAAVQAA